MFERQLRDLSTGIASGRKDEFGKLTVSINSMISSMRVLIEQLRLFRKSVLIRKCCIRYFGHASAVSEISKAIRR